VVRRARPGAAWIGDTQFWNDGGRIMVETPVRQGTPLYDAGVEMGDHLAQFDGAPIAHVSQVDSIVATHRPGDRIPVVFIGRSGARQVVLTLAENPHLEFVPGEEAGQPPTLAQLAFRQRWLSSVRKD
jgi:predicted metalloprotease with PDZ domain